MKMIGQCVGGNIVYGTDRKAVEELVAKLKKQSSCAHKWVCSLPATDAHCEKCGMMA